MQYQSQELRPGYGFAIASLTLGILCVLILGFIFSILGIVFGILSLKTQGRDIGIAGLVLCIIMTVVRVFQTPGYSWNYPTNVNRSVDSVSK